MTCKSAQVVRVCGGFTPTNYTKHMCVVTVLCIFFHFSVISGLCTWVLGKRGHCIYTNLPDLIMII